MGIKIIKHLQMMSHCTAYEPAQVPYTCLTALRLKLRWKQIQSLVTAFGSLSELLVNVGKSKVIGCSRYENVGISKVIGCSRYENVF